MRRISLALALVGAIAAAGCGGNKAPDSSGTSKGTPGSTFTVEVRQPLHGSVVSGYMRNGAFVANNLINCGTSGTLCSADFPWDPAAPNSIVALQATADTGYIIEGWAGSCGGGDAVCVLSGLADKFVMVRFSTVGTATSHPNWSPSLANSTLHVTAMRTFALQCNRCHGTDWQGVAIAPSCYGCHANFDTFTVADPVTATTQGPHFDRNGFTGHNSGTCARCHTSGGFLDYLGADNTPSNVLAIQYPSGAGGLDGSSFAAGPFICKTCHNHVSDPTYGTLSQKKFPSGKIVTTDPASALCSQCHDGGRPGYEISKVQAVLALNPTVGADAQLTASNGVVRAHYLPAASTLFGSEASNWYEYSGQIYSTRNEHGGRASCSFCHDPHTGLLPADSDIRAKCGACHFNEAGAAVSTLLEVEDARQFGYEGDFDGNGLVETLNLEYQGLGAKLLAAIQAYATNVAGQSICFADNKAWNYSGTGACDSSTATGVAYTHFTPRLLKATYNYLMFQNDFGAWAHNPRYAIEVLFDTINDVNAGLGTNAVAFTGLRASSGHFGATSATAPEGGAVFTDWNSTGTIPAGCAMCHGGETGMANYWASLATTTTGPTAGMPSIVAFECTTCHAPLGTDANFKRMRAGPAKIYFPPEKADSLSFAFDPTVAGTYLTAGDKLCMTCHSGREGFKSVNAKTYKSGWVNSFTNPHYLGAAGVMMGTNGKMMFEYTGKTYSGYPAFWGSPHGSPHGQSCAGCHRPQASKHTFEVDFAYCGGCHAGNYALAPIEEEYQLAAQNLYTTIQAYAVANVQAIKDANVKTTFDNDGTGGLDPVLLNTTLITGVCYNGGAYPYWYVEMSGVCQDGVNNTAGAQGPTVGVQAKFDKTAALAAFNYKWTQADPGAWAHNEFYVFQVMYDTIVSLGQTPNFKVAAKKDYGTGLPIPGDPLNRGY